MVTALASLLGTGAVSDFNFAFALLQIPLGIIGVPLGIVLLPTLSRRRGRRSRGRSSPALLTRALRLLDLRHGPDRGAGRGRSAPPLVEILFGSGKISQADLDLIAATLVAFLVGLTAHALIAVLARAFYARQDTVTPVVAAVGAVAINCTLAVVLVGPLGCPGIALAIAVAAWIEALALLVILYRRLPHLALSGSGPRRRRGGGRQRPRGGRCRVGARHHRWRDRRGPGPRRPADRASPSSASPSVLVYAAVSLALRIPELPSIVGVMADVLRRPVGS